MPLTMSLPRRSSVHGLWLVSLAGVLGLACPSNSARAEEKGFHGVSSGAATCDGAVLIRVMGNPLTKPAGILGLGFVAVGVGYTAKALSNTRKTGRP